MNNAEHREQCRLVQQCRQCGEGVLPDSSLHIPDLIKIHAIPNGGKRTRYEAGALIREGVRAGVPDLCLPIARGGYHGLYIEMKAPGKIDNTSKEQDSIRAEHIKDGYKSIVCDHWETAWAEILTYMSKGPSLSLEGPPDITAALCKEHLL